MSVGTRVGENPRSPSCLDLVLRGRLAYEAELGASNPSYDGWAARAVTGITFVGDGIGKAKGRLTVANRPFRSLRGFERNRDIATGTAKGAPTLLPTI
jgi:hypothetical protein